MTKEVPGFTLERVHAAIEGRFDPANLSSEERIYYYEMLDEKMTYPSAEVIAAAEKRGQQPGAVGYDEAGRLVRRRADGGLDVLEE